MVSLRRLNNLKRSILVKYDHLNLALNLRKRASETLNNFLYLVNALSTRLLRLMSIVQLARNIYWEMTCLKGSINLSLNA